MDFLGWILCKHVEDYTLITILNQHKLMMYPWQLAITLLIYIYIYFFKLCNFITKHLNYFLFYFHLFTCLLNELPSCTSKVSLFMLRFYSMVTYSYKYRSAVSVFVPSNKAFFLHWEASMWSVLQTSHKQHFKSSQWILPHPSQLFCTYSIALHPTVYESNSGTHTLKKNKNH